MNPQDTGKAYDTITHLWAPQRFNNNNGIEQHKRALAFAHRKGRALDVGCGPTGRFIELLQNEGFVPEGVDVSSKMIALAAERHPGVTFHHKDICQWSPPGHYDVITAWDSIWHIPLSQQKPVVTKLVSCLSPGGVLIFSFGGTDKAGQHTDDAMGPEVYYSTLGTRGFLSLLLDLGCTCKHLEYDQSPQDLHAYVIAQRPAQ